LQRAQRDRPFSQKRDFARLIGVLGINKSRTESRAAPCVISLNVGQRYAPGASVEAPPAVWQAARTRRVRLASYLTRRAGKGDVKFHGSTPRATGLRRLVGDSKARPCGRRSRAQHRKPPPPHRTRQPAKRDGAPAARRGQALRPHQVAQLNDLAAFCARSKVVGIRGVGRVGLSLLRVATTP
jgi:hypothetical protein